MVADSTHPAFAAAFLNTEDKAVLCDTAGRILCVSEALRRCQPNLPDDPIGHLLSITSAYFSQGSAWHLALSGSYREARFTGEASVGAVSLNPLNLFTIHPLKANRQLTGYRVTFNRQTHFEESLPTSAWQELFNNSHTGICLFDATFKILGANPRFRRLTGIAQDETVKIHQVLSVDGDFQEWLLHSTSLNADAQIVRNPDCFGQISVTMIELGGQQLFWCSLNDASVAHAPDVHRTGSRDRFSQLIDANANAIALVSADGRFTDVNQQFAKLLKRNREDIIGQHVTHFNAPDSNELPADDALRFQQTGVARPFEKTLMRSDGQTIKVLVQLFPNKTSDGVFAGAWNFIQEIDSSVRNQLDRDRHLEQILTSTEDLIVLTDLDNRILMVNSALAKQVSQSPDALVGRNVHDLIRSEDAELENRLHRPVLMKQGFTDLYEQRLTRIEQPDLPVSVRRSLLRNHQQRPEAIWTIMRDASVQHKLISSLANAERRFRSLFSNSIDAIAFWTGSDELRYANRAYLDLIGYSQEELRDLTYRDFTPPGWEEADLLMAEQITERGYTDIVEKEVLRKDGSIVPITLRASAVRDDTGETVGSWIIVRDISELKKTLRRLQHSENMLQQTSRMSRVGGWELDVEQMMFTLTEETFQLLSIPRSFQTSVRNIAKLFDVSSEDEAVRRVQRVYKTGSSETIEMKLAGFSPERWVRVSAQLGFEDQGIPYVYGAIQDISEFIKQQRSLETARDTYQQLAFHDPLTQLPNRLLIEDRFQQISSQARRDNNQVAMMVLDLDDFKLINDRHGHPAGDALLVNMADRLQNTIRASDTVARLGGDEFVLIAMLGEADQVRNLAEKIIANINQPFVWNGIELRSACSVGIALMSGDDDSFENLYARADQALYSVKAGDKGTFHISLNPD